MKEFGPKNTIKEILDEMVENDQAMSMLSLSITEGEGPDFVVVAAQSQFAEALAKIVHMIGQEIEEQDVGAHRQTAYTMDEDGNLIPSEPSDG